MNRSVRDQSHLTRSPQPLRSPSPDIVAANMITSTRTPTTEIPAIPNFRHNRQDIPLFEEIDRLRRENQQLREQLSFSKNQTGRQSLPTGGSRDQQVGRLLEELRQKQVEIESLKRGLDNSASKLSKSSKKLTLVGNDATHMRELSDKIRDLTDENRRLKDELRGSAPISSQNTDNESRQLRHKVRVLQEEIQDLKRELHDRPVSRFKTEPSPDYDSARLNIELRRVREELFQHVERLFQKITEKLVDLDRRVVDIMGRQTTLLAQTRGSKKDQGSTAGRPTIDPSNSNRTEFNTPDKPNPTVISQYVWNSVSGVPGQGTTGLVGQAGQSGAPSISHSTVQLESQITSQKGRISKLEADLKKALFDLDGMRLQNKSIRDQNNYLSSQLNRQRSDVEAMRRIEKENNELKATLHSKVFTLDQQGRDRILRDNEVSQLNKVIQELNKRLDYIQTEKNQEIIRLQHENRLLKESLESLGRQNHQLIGKLERNKAVTAPSNATTTPAPTPTIVQSTVSNDFVLSRQNSQLKAELQEVRANNSFLENANSVKEEQLAFLKKEESHMRSVNGELTRQLSQALEEVNRQKQVVASQQSEITNLRGLLERMNSDLGELTPLRVNVDQLQAECARLRRINEQADRSIAILKSQKQYVIRQAEEYIKTVEQLRGTLRSKEEELIQLIEARRSPAMDAYLRDLADLKRELETLNLEPLQMEIHERNERIKVLLSEKLMTTRLSTKQVQDIEALLRENDRLRKEVLAAESRCVSAKEDVEKLKALLESKDHEKASLERQVSELKGIISEYISREVVHQQGALPAQTQREIRQIEEEISISQSLQQRSLHDISTLKANFEQAILKLDTISSKIRQQLGRPQQSLLSQTIRTTTSIVK